MPIPLITSGEFLTVASQGIEKRMISHLEYKETPAEYENGKPATWYEMRIIQKDVF